MKQLGLLDEDGPPFDPMPSGPRHYVVAVQNHPGELDALTKAAAEVRGRLTPLVQLLGPKLLKGPLRRERVSAWIKKIAPAVGDSPFFLDILRLSPYEKVAGGEAVLERIFANCRRRDLRFVPVVNMGAREPAIDLISEAVRLDQRGVCVRYPVMELVPPSGSSHGAVLQETVNEVGVPIDEADLLIDLSWLDLNESLPTNRLGSVIDALAQAGPWRNFVLMATTMPRMLGGHVDEGTLGRLPRLEWELWTALRTPERARIPSFGDYAIQHPIPAFEGGGPGMRANIRYTTETATLVARGEGAVIHEGKEQYRSLCQQLVGLAEFAGPDYTWGDYIIRGCADGVIPPGSQHMWRGAGTSHHLRVVSDQLGRMASIT